MSSPFDSASLPSKPLTAGCDSDSSLEKILKRLPPELDLSGKIVLDETKARATGGYCEIYHGVIEGIEGSNGECVAVRRPRFAVLPDDINTITVIARIARVRHLLTTNFLQRKAREIHLWAKLNHMNILSLKGILDEGNLYPSLVTPWMKNGNARQYLRSNENVCIISMVLNITLYLSQTIIALIQAEGIAAGMAYLHEEKIIHADLKAVCQP